MTPFSFPLTVPSTLAFGLFGGRSCVFRLQPRLTVSHRSLSLSLSLRRALSVAAHGSLLVPLSLFALSFAVALRGTVERQVLCELSENAGVPSPFTRLVCQVRRHLSEHQLVDVWRRLTPI